MFSGGSAEQEIAQKRNVKWAAIGLSEVFVNRLTAVLWCTNRAGIVACSQHTASALLRLGGRRGCHTLRLVLVWFFLHTQSCLDHFCQPRNQIVCPDSRNATEHSLVLVSTFHTATRKLCTPLSTVNLVVGIVVTTYPPSWAPIWW